MRSAIRITSALLLVFVIFLLANAYLYAVGVQQPILSGMWFYIVAWFRTW